MPKKTTTTVSQSELVDIELLASSVFIRGREEIRHGIQPLVQQESSRFLYAHARTDGLGIYCDHMVFTQDSEQYLSIQQHWIGGLDSTRSTLYKLDKTTSYLSVVYGIIKS